MGQLNIKDAQLIAEAKELAALLGTSTTAALREAVQERLAREKRARDATLKAQEIIDFAKEFRRGLSGPPMTMREIDEMLYDPATGLPR